MYKLINLLYIYILRNGITILQFSHKLGQNIQIIKMSVINL